MRSLSIIALAAALAAMPAVAKACDDHAPGTEPVKRAATQRSALVAGEVREIDAEEGTVTLSHARIAGLRMKPMSSMQFRTEDRALLAGLKPGDAVRFRAELVGAQPTVVEIRRVAR